VHASAKKIVQQFHTTNNMEGEPKLPSIIIIKHNNIFFLVFLSLLTTNHPKARKQPINSRASIKKKGPADKKMRTKKKSRKKQAEKSANQTKDLPWKSERIIKQISRVQWF